MSIPVYRKVNSWHSNSWPTYIANARLSVLPGGSVYFQFVNEKTTGPSCYKLVLEPEHFRDLIEAMLRANADETVKAVANALKDGIPVPDPVPKRSGQVIERVILPGQDPTEAEREARQG